MDIDLRRLRHVVGLARIRHYQRAARELGISQPALTKPIQATEAEFGLKLFDRDRSGVNVTSAGAPIVEMARELLDNAERLKSHVGRIASGDEGDLAFGIAPLPAQALLRSGLEAAMRQSAGISHHAVIRDASALMELLLADEIEFFVAAEGQLTIRSAVNIDFIGIFPVSLIVRKGHPLLKYPHCSEKFPLLLASPAPDLSVGTFDILEHLSGVVQIIEDYNTLAHLTSTSDAIWLSSRFAVSDEIIAGNLLEMPWPKGAQPPIMRMGFYTLARRSISIGSARLRRIFQAQSASLSKAL